MDHSIIGFLLKANRIFKSVEKDNQTGKIRKMMFTASNPLDDKTTALIFSFVSEYLQRTEESQKQTVIL